MVTTTNSTNFEQFAILNQFCSNQISNTEIKPLTPSLALGRGFSMCNMADVSDINSTEPQKSKNKKKIAHSTNDEVFEAQMLRSFLGITEEDKKKIGKMADNVSMLNEFLAKNVDRDGSLRIKHAIDDDSLEKIGDVVEKKTEDISDSFIDKIKSKIPSLDSIEKWTTPAAIILGCIALARYYRGKPVCRTTIYIACALAIPSTMHFIKPWVFELVLKLNEAAGSIKPKDDKEDVFVAQMEISSLVSSDSIWTVASALAGICLSWAIRDGATVTKLVKTIISFKDFSRIRDGVSSVFEFIIEMFEGVTNGIRNYLGYDSVFFLKSGFNDVYELYNKVEGVLKIAATEDVLSETTIDKIRHFEVLLQVAEKNVAAYGRRETKLVIGIRKILTPLIERVTKLNRGKSGSRIAPVTILCIGESQIGKSVSSMQFLKGVIARTLPKERVESFLKNPDSEIYCKPDSSQYWEKYYGQWSQIADDVGYLNTIPGVPSVESDMISLKNTTPFPLDMAFGEKGSTYYTSRIWFGTSNTEYWDPKNLTYKDAFINRFDFAFITAVRADKKYCINPEEPNPMRRMLRPDYQFDEEGEAEHLEYIVYDIKKRHQVGARFKNSQYSLEECCGASLTMSEAMDMVVRFFEDQEKRHAIIMSSHNKVIRKSIKKRSRPIANIEDETTDDEGLTDTEQMFSAQMASDSRKKSAKGNSSKIKIDDRSVSLTANELLYYGTAPYGSAELRSRAIEPDEFRSTTIPYNYFARTIGRCKNKGIYRDEDIQDYVSQLEAFGRSYYFEKCPISNEQSSTIYVPFEEEADAYDYLYGYLYGISVEQSKRRQFLKTYGKLLMAQFPSPFNKNFIDQAEKVKMDPMSVGFYVAAIIMEKKEQFRCYFRKIKRALKDFIYKSFGVVKEAMKVVLSGDWIMSAMSKILTAAAYTGIAFAGVALLMNVVKSTLGMDSFVKGTGLVDYNGSVIRESIAKVDEPVSSQSVNLKVLKGFQNMRSAHKAQIDMQAQFAIDPTMENMVESFVKRNVMCLYHGDKLLGSIWILAERLALMPKHYKPLLMDKVNQGAINKNNPVKVRSWDHKDESDFPWLPKADDFEMPLEHLKNADIACVRFDRSFLPRPNKTHFLIRVNDVERIVSEQQRGRLCIIEGSNRRCNVDVKIRLDEGHNRKVINGYSSPYNWIYDGYTKEGNCGAILAVHDRAKPGPGRIIGMHTAGNRTSSIGVPIMYEDAIELLEFYGIEYTTEEDSRIEYNAEGVFNRSPHPALWCEEQLPAPKYSRIAPSPLHNMIDKTDKRPAILTTWTRGQEFVDPIAIALSKQIPKSVLLNQRLVDIIIHEYYRFIVENSVNGKQGSGKIYSVVESCVGVPGDTCIKGIPRKTSAGHPYNMIAKNFGGGKKLWFGTKEQYDTSGPFFEKMQARVLDIIEKAKNGHRYNHVTLVFPKDECLETKKVEQEGKVRLIMGAPMDHSIAGRCLNLEFMKFMIENSIFNWSGVGIDPHNSYQWGLIADRLKNLNIIEADQKSYDGRMQPMIASSWTSLCNLYYNDEYKKARDIIDLELYFSKHIMDGVVTERRGTHASGNYATVFVNTVSNIVTVLYAMYVVKFGNDEVQDPVQVRQWCSRIFNDCYGIFVGDDFLLGVPDYMKDDVNFFTLQEGMEAIGYTITSPSKDSSVVDPFVKLEDATFLKRRFVYEDKYGWYAPLELSSILNQINWVSKKNFLRTDYLLCIESYCHELSLHGDKEFDHRFAKLKKLCEELLNYVPKYSARLEYFEDRANSLRMLTDEDLGSLGPAVLEGDTYDVRTPWPLESNLK